MPFFTSGGFVSNAKYITRFETFSRHHYSMRWFIFRYNSTETRLGDKIFKSEKKYNINNYTLTICTSLFCISWVFLYSFILRYRRVQQTTKAYRTQNGNHGSRSCGWWRHTAVECITSQRSWRSSCYTGPILKRLWIL